MHSVDWPGANFTLIGGPHVNDLRCYRDELRTVALFEFSPLEIVDVLLTHRVALTVLGHLWPPVRLDSVKLQPKDISTRITQVAQQPTEKLLAAIALMRTALEAIALREVSSKEDLVEEYEEVVQYATDVLGTAKEYFGEG